MATYLFGVRLDDPPLLRDPNLLQSNTMDDNNKHRDVRIPLPFLDGLSRFNQEAVYARRQDPQPLPSLDMLSRFNHQEPQPLPSLDMLSRFNHQEPQPLPSLDMFSRFNHQEPQPLPSLDMLSRFNHQEPQPLPSLDMLSRFNQEAVYARHQEPEEKKSTARRPGPRLVLSLVLMTPGSYDWNIKKTLTSSDVNDLCRLMLKTTVVQEHILSKWGKAQRTAVMETEHGLRVSVLDINTDTVHELVFKKWRSSGSFVFTNNWVTQFVRRRGLKAGDKIGLNWDSERSMFLFCVLSLA
ncbi:hypothetical protein RHSIM_Rhsim07G0090700 [Rhododendron simsii]|uniref:TF-B3 domain-containing protein n=1 Tax=Rhododendron simsii TaxID=118357 RepID=A0A834GNP7_RHOSS|nr:hypothetical protein RHSIM_Rhsim07G0090700 [Rhododendron simsii]